MSVLDYASFPHIFDAVLDHLVATRDEFSLRVIYRLSRSARDRVYDKCRHHLTLDYRLWPVMAGTTVGGFWRPDHHPVRSVVDIVAWPDDMVNPLAPKVHAWLERVAPHVICLLDHYGMQNPLSYGPVDTVVFHTKNWFPASRAEPNPWYLMLPANANRVTVNLIGCAEFGYPHVRFMPGHDQQPAQQELVLIVTDGGAPPPAAQAVTTNPHYLFDSVCDSIMAFLATLPGGTVTLVGVDGWNSDYTELAPLSEDEPGDHLFTRAFTKQFHGMTGGQPDAAVLDALLQRITHVSREQFKDDVGQAMFELMTKEEVPPQLKT